MDDRRPHGFRIIDLIAVIGVCGIVLGLTLPVIQRNREAARRTDCANHLKQISLALYNYIATYDTLPPSGSRDDDAGGLQRSPWNDGVGPRQNAWSMKSRLMGYMISGPYFNSMNFQLDPTWTPMVNLLNRRTRRSET